MIISESNGELINSKAVYIHDDVFKSLYFDRDNKTIILALSRGDNLAQEYTIKFTGVIGFKMTSCDFWGASECVFDFEYVPPKERIIIPELQRKWLETPNQFANVSYNDYIETLLTFTSGDQLTIACKIIEVGK